MTKGSTTSHGRALRSAALLAVLITSSVGACSCGRGSSETHEARREGLAQGGGETTTTTEITPAIVPREEPSSPSAQHPDLGTLPTELASLQWPALPRIERTVQARSAAEAQRAVDVPRTRVRVLAPIREAITIHASDVEITFEDGGRLERVIVDRGVQRVRIAGGEVGSVELMPPAQWNPDAEYDESLFVTDVTLENLRMVASDSAFVIRGRRVAVLGNDVHAERYSLWAGDTGPFDGEDLIVADNTFRSAGPESTLRMHDVLRSVVVRNVLSNGAKHDYRVHGRGDLAYAAHNVLLRTGIMIGNQPGDRVGTVIFEDNVLHHEAPSLLEIEFSAIRRLVMRNNVVYTNVWEAFYPYPRIGDGWTIEGNERFPFRAYEAPAAAPVQTTTTVTSR